MDIESLSIGLHFKYIDKIVREISYKSELRQ